MTQGTHSTFRQPLTREAKMDAMRELGLNDNEVRLITTPITQLTKDKSLMEKLIKADDKRRDLIQKRNEKDSAKEASKKKTFIERVRGEDGKGPSVHTYETT